MAENHGGSSKLSGGLSANVSRHQYRRNFSNHPPQLSRVSTRYSPSASRSRRSPAERGANRTVADNERLRRLETIRSLWLNADGMPTIPPAAIRSLLETGARKLRQGAQVREGLVVVDTSFVYDIDVYGETLDELAERAQFTVPVVVKGIRLMRTRPKFDPPWSCTFTVDADDELVDQDHLARWLDIGGRRIGLGDWRPEKSGEYGRFSIGSIQARELELLTAR